MIGSAVVVSLVFVAAAATVAAPRVGPRETVQEAVHRVMGVLRDVPVSRDAGESGRAAAMDRRAEIRRIARGLFDYEEASRRALGRYWLDQTSEERTEFVRLFTAVLERAYVDKIETYLESRMSFLGETVDGAYATVRSRVITPRRMQTTVDYQAHLREGRWRVYDLVIDGVSFVSNYRSQFDHILKHKSYAALLTLMRNAAVTGTLAASPRTTK
jgi:phospholipid transport system substrate-binding protein